METIFVLMTLSLNPTVTGQDDRARRSNYLWRSVDKMVTVKLATPVLESLCSQDDFDDWLCGRPSGGS